jgi:uncharacterized protein (TIGR03067 family)
MCFRNLARRALSNTAAVALAMMAVPLVAQTAPSLNGNWTITNGTLHGQPVPANVLSVMSLNITNSDFVAKSGNLNSTGSITVNAQANPAQLDFAITGGADQGRRLKAIYRLENAVLTITFSENDQYPAGFDSSADNKYLTLVYGQGTGNSTVLTPSNSEGNGAGSGVQ